MPIIPADLQVRLSAPAASAGNLSVGTAGNSLGRFIATNVLVDNVLGNLFPDVTGDENAASNVDYQCLFLLNNHPTLTLIAPWVWIQSEISGGVSVALGADVAAASLLGSSTAQAAVIDTKNTAPSGVSFSAGVTKQTGVALGDVPPGSVRAFWVRRTASDTPAQNADGVTVRVQGDTLA